MTATPLRDDNRDTYLYFGNPLYTYSLRQGIDDGFLAPYRVHRIVTTWDAAGWRPTKGELDRYGREIPDEEYGTKDFERVVALRGPHRGHRQAPDRLPEETDRFAKTIVFCVDQEHADEMRQALNNLNADLVQQYPDYVCRVTADEGDIGRGPPQPLPGAGDARRRYPHHLAAAHDRRGCADLQEHRARSGHRLDVEFKQIIGRGTRVRDDYGKLFFNILDYTGSRHAPLRRPGLRRRPAFVTEEEIDEAGKSRRRRTRRTRTPGRPARPTDCTRRASSSSHPTPSAAKYYVDGGQVEIAAHLVYELDPNGKAAPGREAHRLHGARRCAPSTRSAAELAQAHGQTPTSGTRSSRRWQNGASTSRISAEAAKQPDADPFDLLCHLAFNAPLRTRRERAGQLRARAAGLLRAVRPEARADPRRAAREVRRVRRAQFSLPDVLKVPPISDTATCWRSPRCSAGRKSSAKPSTDSRLCSMQPKLK